MDRPPPRGEPLDCWDGYSSSSYDDDSAVSTITPIFGGVVVPISDKWWGIPQKAAGPEGAEPSAKRAKIDHVGKDAAEAARPVIKKTLGLSADLSPFDSREYSMRWCMRIPRWISR